MDRADLADAALWFRGHANLTGNARCLAYNEAQRVSVRMELAYPMSERFALCELHKKSQAGAIPPLAPSLGTRFGHWLDGLCAVAVSAPLKLSGAVPSLVSICAAIMVPEYLPQTVCQAVHHFVGGTANDTRALAAELRRSHVPRKIRFLCALAEAQIRRELPPNIPAGFPELLTADLQTTAACTGADYKLQHDLCKVRVVHLILSKGLPDSDFSDLCYLLGDCATPGMVDAYGTSVQVFDGIAQLLCDRQLKLTACALLDSPF